MILEKQAGCDNKICQQCQTLMCQYDNMILNRDTRSFALCSLESCKSLTSPLHSVYKNLTRPEDPLYNVTQV